MSTEKRSAASEKPVEAAESPMQDVGELENRQGLQVSGSNLASARGLFFFFFLFGLKWIRHI